MAIVLGSDGAWPSFAQPGRGDPHLGFAILARMQADALSAFLGPKIGAGAWWDNAEDLLAEADGGPIDPVAYRASWWIQAGHSDYAAAVSLEPAWDDELASRLARATGAPAYLLLLAGYDDPDDGCPSIRSADGTAVREVWSEASAEQMVELLTDGDEGRRAWATRVTLEARAGHDAGIRDPWSFARSLGVSLQSYRRDAVGITSDWRLDR
jgi:hypothetical protein